MRHEMLTTVLGYIALLVVVFLLMVKMRFGINALDGQTDSNAIVKYESGKITPQIIYS